VIYTKTIERDAINQSMFRLLSDINSLSETSCITDRLIDQSADIVQNLIYRRYLLKDGTDRVISDIILREAISCENKSAGSGGIFLLTVKILIERFLRESQVRERKDIICDIKRDLINFCNSACTHLSKLGSSQFNSIIDDMFPEKDLKSLIRKLCDSINLNTSISVKKTPLRDSEFFIDSGHNIFVDNFKVMLAGSEWNRKHVNMLAIDGTIDSVGEIHHLLESASNSKIPTLVLCRKISDEVRQTVNYNLIRKTIDMAFIEVDFLPESSHLFKDFEILTGCDIISTEKGDTISNGAKHNIFHLREVKLSTLNLKIYLNENLKDRKNLIDSHLDEINSHKFSANRSEVTDELFENRTRMFSSNTCDLYIGKDITDKYHDAISRLDSFLRSVKDFMSSGVVNIGEIDGNTFIKTKRKFLNQNQIFYSIVSSLKTLEILANTQKVLTVDI